MHPCKFLLFTLTSMWLREITTRQEQRFLLELAHLSERQWVSSLAGARSHTVIQSLQEWIVCRVEGGVCTVCYPTCMIDVCSLSEKAGIEITAGIKLYCREKSSTVGRKAPLSGEKLHCREKSSHDGNKTRQTGTNLASSDLNPNARMDRLSRIRRGVTLLVCLTCVPCPKWQGLESPRESSSTVGRKAPLSGEKLARREQSSPDGNKTRQQ